MIRNSVNRMYFKLKINPLLIVQLVVVSCSSNVQTQPASADTNLRIDQDGIFTPVILNATDTLEMLFDTGCLVGCLLPRSLAENYADSLVVSTQQGTASSIEVKSISLGGQSLNSNIVHHVPVETEATIAPVYATEERVWCFDLDNSIFSICETDTLPENAIVYPLLFAKYKDRKIAPFVNIPMTLSCGDHSLSTDYIYLLDTGTPYGFTITDPPTELENFVSRIPHWEIEDNLCSENPGRKLLDFEVDIDTPDFILPHVRCVFDTGLRSMSGEFKGFLPDVRKPIVGTLGMRILKHFNMILDFKNGRLILTPAQRTFPSKPANRVGFWCDSKGVVTRIRTNDAAYGQGLRLADTVMTVNGSRWIDIPQQRREELYSTKGHSIWEINSSEGTKTIIIENAL